MQEKVEVNYCDYHTIPPKESINLLGTLEAWYGRRHAGRESQKPVSKDNKSYQSGGAGYNS